MHLSDNIFKRPFFAPRQFRRSAPGLRQSGCGCAGPGSSVGCHIRARFSHPNCSLLTLGCCKLQNSHRNGISTPEYKNNHTIPTALMQISAIPFGPEKASCNSDPARPLPAWRPRRQSQEAIDDRTRSRQSRHFPLYILFRRLVSSTVTTLRDLELHSRVHVC